MVGAVLLPVIYLIIRAVQAGEAGIKYLFSGRTFTVIGNSLMLTLAVTLSSVLIGTLFGWLTSRTDLPLRRLWLISGLLPLVIPSYIGAMTFTAAFGTKGYLQAMLAPLGVAALPSIYGFFGAWLVITLFTYPYVVIPVRTALLNADPALEESARSMGLNAWAVFRRVTLPQLRPALGIGIVLSALYTLSDFGAVAIMQFDAFTRVIFVQYTSSFNRGLAAVLSLVLVVIALGLIVLERRLSCHSRNYRIGVGASRKPRPIRLGRWRFPALLFCTSLVMLGVGTPLLVLLAWLHQGVQRQIEMPALGVPLQNTLAASVLAALTVGAAAIPLAILGARARGRVARWLVQLTFLGNGLPGLVIALSLVFFAANALPGLYQTLPILVFGYVVRFLPLSVGATRSALTQINPRLEEAGRSLGFSSWRVALRVTVPLVRTGALGGMALVFLNTMKELPTTLLLSPIGFRSLTGQLWSAQNDAMWTQAAAPALVIIVVSALSLGLILRRDNHLR
ncbi:MAG: iron ABC transporter permease, partial [Anaerolinea sp.]|nr:iron ABC transporter permease [Anaerolinea sp.]